MNGQARLGKELMNQHSALPRTPIGIDLRVPSDRKIIKSLRNIKDQI